MNIYIDKINLFKNILSTGVNLFTGAGFSKLPDENGVSLPDAKDLCKEICDKFSINARYCNDLEKLSNIVNTRAKQQFQHYLREKYTVTSYNPLYDELNKINLKSFITTNIDNIIQCVAERSDKYYLHNIVNFGPSKKNSTAITYIPLHGEVKNIESNLYFGKNELANVDDDNRDLFNLMHSQLLQYPTIFIGYGFHDNAVERTIVKMLENPNNKIWIQCLPDSDNIDYFRDLGCYVIVGSTEDFLQWIRDTIKDNKESSCTPNVLINFPEYSIPTINSLSTISREQYFTKGETGWFCTLSNFAYKTKFVDNIHDKYFVNKNIFVVGIPFSGKTTIMQQLAILIDANIKLCIEDLTCSKAKLIINKLGDASAVIFIDNCCEDIEATKLLMKHNNIKVIGFTDDYSLESTKHIIDDVNYTSVDICDLDIADAQRIYEKIPETIRMNTFCYKKNSNEKFSMLEMMGQNVKGAISIKRIENILSNIKETNDEAFQVIILTTYLSSNYSALSTDVLISYFGTTDYDRIRSLLNLVHGYLSDFNIDFSEDMLDQDYFTLRSSLFIYYAKKVLQKNFKNDFARVIHKFILNVPPYKIYKYYIFKRSAYDAKLFYALFGGKAYELYDHIYRFDDNEYTLQQIALYKSYTGDYAGAFSDIDSAINRKPKNLSIRNTRAIILFYANKDKKNETSSAAISEAMETLENCLNGDKRKAYHARIYSEFAIFLSKEWNDHSYLLQAKKWLDNIIKNDVIVSKSTKHHLCEVEKQIKMVL